VITAENKQIVPPQLLQAKAEQFIVILGPTASGKTALAVSLAKQLQGVILSADSRQVYRHMNIGTGKDLSEYEDVPYALIDICEPGEKYHISRFQDDFFEALEKVRAQGKTPILCGGTGLYIQAVLQGSKYSQVPVDPLLRERLQPLSREELQQILAQKVIPEDLKIDQSTAKRLIRGIEIISYIEQYGPNFKQNPAPVQQAIIIGLNPDRELRRQKISKRLIERIDSGMIAEVEQLLAHGLSHEELQYYGLEYKYISLYLQGKMSYAESIQKLEVEIHRYARRQMTYFRKMEKDGLQIHWISSTCRQEQLAQSLQIIKKG